MPTFLADICCLHICAPKLMNIQRYAPWRINSLGAFYCKKIISTDCDSNFEISLPLVTHLTLNAVARTYFTGIKWQKVFDFMSSRELYNVHALEFVHTRPQACFKVEWFLRCCFSYLRSWFLFWKIQLRLWNFKLIPLFSFWIYTLQNFLSHKYFRVAQKRRLIEREECLVNAGKKPNLIGNFTLALVEIYVHCKCVVHSWWTPMFCALTSIPQLKQTAPNEIEKNIANKWTFWIIHW